MESLELVKSNSTYLEDFKSLAERLCRILETEGLERRPYLPGLPYFGKLPAEKQREIVEALTWYVDLCKEQMLDGYKLSDNLSFTWRAFRKLHFVPRADFFNYVTDEDIVEIYSKDNRQLYRNLRFFEYSSYSLEELYSLEWWALYERDEEATTALYQVASKVLSGEIEGNVIPDVKPHVVRELCSMEKLSHMYEARLLSPLHRHKQVEGIIAVLGIIPIQN